MDQTDRVVDIAEIATCRISFLSGEPAAAAEPAIFINAGDREARLQRNHMLGREIRGAGLSFLEKAGVTGHGYIIHDGTLVFDAHSPAGVSHAFAKNDGLTSPPRIAERDIRYLDRPLLAIAGPGYPIWGHWLLDFLPRIALAQSVLGRDIGGHSIPLPIDTPDWVFRMLLFFLGIGPDRIVLYDRDGEQLLSKSGICVPDYLHTDYSLHSYIIDFYRGFVGSPDARDRRKICVSRKEFGISRSVARSFIQRAEFEQMASDRGYKVVSPEAMTFREQIDMFSDASVVVGEFGSGMHSTLFSRPNTVVGQFVMPSNIQSRIGALCRHRNVFLIPDGAPDFNSAEPAVLSVPRSEQEKFFDAVEGLLP